MRKFSEISKNYMRSKRSSVTVYVTLRVVIFLCMIGQLLNGDLINAFLCILALIFFTMPVIIQHQLKIELPNLLEIIIFVFIFASKILGEIYNFYGNIPHWDSMLHAINGFICVGIGFGLVDLLNTKTTKVKLSPLYVSLAAFCFSMTVGVCWEFYEYASDKVLDTDMQKDTVVEKIVSVELDPLKRNKSFIVDNIDKTIVYDVDGNELVVINGGYLDIGLNDTMKDLIVNFTGAIPITVLGYFYIKNRDKYKFTENFIPKKAVNRADIKKS